MLEAQYGTRGPFSWRKWYVCRICANDYPEDQVVLRHGVAYCIPGRDYLDLPEHNRNKQENR